MTFRTARLAPMVFLIAFLGTGSWGAGHPVLQAPGSIVIRPDEELNSLEAASEKKYQEGRYQEAIRLFSQALKRYPTCGQFYFGRGMAYEVVKNPKAAERDYRQAIRLDPKDYEAMENLAGILERTGRSTPEAVKLYRKALELDPRPVWKENLSVWIRILESTLRADSESAVAVWHLGNVRARKGKLGEAIRCYSRAIELNPLFYQAYFSRALLQVRIGDQQAALSDLTMAVDLSPGLRGALVQRALLYERLGKQHRAMDDLGRAVQVDPGDPAAHYHMGRMLQEEGQYLAAAESWRQALRLRPKPELKALILGHLEELRGVTVRHDADRSRIRSILRHLW